MSLVTAEQKKSECKHEYEETNQPDYLRILNSNI